MATDDRSGPTPDLVPYQSHNPYDLEDEGYYEAAAVTWAEEGFATLLEREFDLRRECRVGVGKLLQAISCDRRAKNQRRPRGIKVLCKPLLQEIHNTAVDPTLSALAAEWLGDMHLMLGDDVALRYYDEAYPHYVDLGWDGKRWRYQPEFMHAHWAIYEFSRYHGGDVPENPDDTSFTERIERKRDLADLVLK